MFRGDDLSLGVIWKPCVGLQRMSGYPACRAGSAKRLYWLERSANNSVQSHVVSLDDPPYADILSELGWEEQ